MRHLTALAFLALPEKKKMNVALVSNFGIILPIDGGPRELTTKRRPIDCVPQEYKTWAGG